MQVSDSGKGHVKVDLSRKLNEVLIKSLNNTYRCILM